MPELSDDAIRDAFAPLRRQDVAAGEVDSAIRRRGAQRRRRTGVAVTAMAAAVAVTAVAALAPFAGDDDRAPGVAALLPARAEAAIAPPATILELTLRVTGSGETANVREWSLAGDGEAMRVRRLITSGALNRPPDDEDSVVTLDRQGRVIDQRGWRPERGGTLEVLEREGGEGRPAGSSTLVTQLRAALARGDLREAGRDRLAGALYGAPCERAVLLLDPATALPRRVEVTFRESTPAGDCGAEVMQREVQTITGVRRLPATAANRGLLEVGDWPVARTGRTTIVERPAGGGAFTIHERFTPLAELPPLPELDER